MKHYLVLGAMFKNEGPYLEEWVRFHLERGVDHLYLYNNGSADGGEAALQPFIDAGSVSLFDWPTPKIEGSQMHAALDCLARARGTSRWMAFLDLDEFLFSPSEDLKSVLREFENEVGIEVNWICYGSSGHNSAPTGGVLGSFVYRAPLQWKRNRQFKTIVNPEQTIKRIPRSHAWEFIGGQRAVNERRERDGEQLGLIFRAERKMRQVFPALYDWVARRFPLLLNRYWVFDRKVSVDRLRINHYVVKSRAEYLDKQARHGSLRTEKYSDEFFLYHDRNEEFDPILDPRITRSS